MQGLYSTSSRAHPRNYDAVQLFGLLGMTLSIAACLHINVELLSWVLLHIE
jgi:hypothetical protein